MSFNFVVTKQACVVVKHGMDVYVRFFQRWKSSVKGR